MMGGVNNNTKRVGWAVCKARGMVGVGNKAVQPPWSLSLGKSTNGPSGPGVQTVSRRYILMEWGRWGRSASISVAIDGFLYLETK